MKKKGGAVVFFLEFLFAGFVAGFISWAAHAPGWVTVVLIVAYVVWSNHNEREEERHREIVEFLENLTLEIDDLEKK